MQNKLKNYAYNIYELTKRNMLIFFKNKTTVFFSLIAPILILVIYILFMGNLQVNMIKDQFPDLNLTEKEILSITNAWMIAGIIGIACLTVALNSMFIAISDKERRVIDDFTASPVKLINLTLSYFISAFILTFFICFIFMTIGSLYLIITGGGLYIFSFYEFLQLIGILTLSSLSAVIGLMCITSFFNKTTTAASFTGIFTALIGFLIGAYLPASVLPKSIQNFANLIPGTHSTALFRQIFMNKVLNTQSITSKVSPEFITQIKDQFGYNLSLFGYELNQGIMLAYLSVSIIIFFILYIVINKLKAKIKR